MNPFQPPSEKDLAITVDSIARHSVVFIDIIERLRRIEGLLTDMLSIEEEEAPAPEETSE